MRLTPHAVATAPRYVNAVGEVELSLRGLEAVEIENLGAARPADGHASLDLSDNLLARLDNFPLLPRLESLIAANNRIAEIGGGVGRALVALRSLVLTNNALRRPADLAPLAALPRLESLCLVGNPVAAAPHYRLYVVHTMPRLRALDFQRIKPRERDEAARLFADATVLERVGAADGGAAGGGGGGAGGGRAPPPRKMGAEERARVMEMIERASSVEEVERLERMLATGAPAER